MQTTALIIGIILAILGIIGIAYNYYTGWMWLLLVLGVIGIIWGFMPGMKKSM